MLTAGINELEPQTRATSSMTMQAAGVPVVYLGLLPLPVLIGPDPELKPILKTVHYILTMTMAAGVAAHAAAALKHHFIDRDDILRRMLPIFPKEKQA